LLLSPGRDFLAVWLCAANSLAEKTMRRRLHQITRGLALLVAVTAVAAGAVYALALVALHDMEQPPSVPVPGSIAAR
jgi:hypothetical protein